MKTWEREQELRKEMMAAPDGDEFRAAQQRYWDYRDARKGEDQIDTWITTAKIMAGIGVVLGLLILFGDKSEKTDTDKSNLPSNEEWGRMTDEQKADAIADEIRREGY